MCMLDYLQWWLTAFYLGWVMFIFFTVLLEGEFLTCMVKYFNLTLIIMEPLLMAMIASLILSLWCRLIAPYKFFNLELKNGQNFGLENGQNLKFVSGSQQLFLDEREILPSKIKTNSIWNKWITSLTLFQLSSNFLQPLWAGNYCTYFT